jgi:enoyl-CoA hydratase/carnithine racemase
VTELITTDFQGVRTLTINRPHKLNALATSTFDVLRDAMVAAAVDRSVRCVVLTGSGRAFSAAWTSRT